MSEEKKEVMTARSMPKEKETEDASKSEPASTSASTAEPAPTSEPAPSQGTQTAEQEERKQRMERLEALEHDCRLWNWRYQEYHIELMDTESSINDFRNRAALLEEIRSGFGDFLGVQHQPGVHFPSPAPLASDSDSDA